MNQSLKKLVLSNTTLTRVAVFFHKLVLKRKNLIRYKRNVFIGFSTVCEGSNFFDSYSSITGSFIGYGSYLSNGTKIAKTKIGRYTSIGPNVSCIFGNHPTEKFVSTHPVFFSTSRIIGYSHTEKQLFSEFASKDEKYSITIGNDVWIGANVSILDGVKIGDGAIIAANALVNKNIPPYSIYGGVPAKLIRKRFSENQIDFLLRFKWWEKDLEWIKSNASEFVDITMFHNKFKNG